MENASDLAVCNAILVHNCQRPKPDALWSIANVVTNNQRVHDIVSTASRSRRQSARQLLGQAMQHFPGRVRLPSVTESARWTLSGKLEQANWTAAKPTADQTPQPFWRVRKVSYLHVIRSSLYQKSKFSKQFTGLCSRDCCAAKQGGVAQTKPTQIGAAQVRPLKT